MSNNVGPVYAKVTDNKDPDQLGRIKVKFESMGQNVESGWLTVLNLFGGFFSIPDKDQHVVVAFVNGNPAQGVVLGAVWTNTNKPPKSGENSGSDFNQDGNNTLRCIVTPGGNKIIIDDKNGDAKIQLINNDGNNRLEFLSQKKKILIKSEKKVTIEAATDVKISADSAEFEFSNGLEIKGTAVNLTEKEKANIKASSKVSIKSLAVKFN
jgi:uncharacterized protein involved in type VI secretion and phage assembly